MTTWGENKAKNPDIEKPLCIINSHLHFEFMRLEDQITIQKNMKKKVFFLFGRKIERKKKIQL